ncbi:hypothetical protein HanRHA438_Chr06g0257431 [Helianthus annuus]|nr:hypothetical protein HanRHA438_Chr06g0257431 [Helianthus annuus]
MSLKDAIGSLNLSSVICKVKIHIIYIMQFMLIIRRKLLALKTTSAVQNTCFNLTSDCDLATSDSTFFAISAFFIKGLLRISSVFVRVLSVFLLDVAEIFSASR